MTRKQERAAIIAAGLALAGAAVFLMLTAFEDSIVFFYSPSDVVEREITSGERFRLGGMVEEDSVAMGQGTQVSFVVTDFAETVPVTYNGILPDLFREGQGVVAEGRLGTDGTFVADTILAKHDENYMPTEVADALKRTGNWQGEGAEAPHSETKGQGAY